MPQTSAGSDSIETKREWIIGHSMIAMATLDSPTDAYEPKSVPTPKDLAEEFQTLRDQWERETAHLSLTRDMATHPAYQRIIGMGAKVIPLIIQEMRKGPGHWFWALRALTGLNPVSHEHRGDLDAMTRDWLAWWDNSGYASR